ncbi:MAG: acyl-CoA thioesterase, partial [Acidimicrobiales bacterium]
MPDPVTDARVPLDRLLGVLELERIEVDLFRGFSPPESRVRVFGGQVAAQALLAAIRTVEAAKTVHSLHAYFLRPGDPTRPIVYQVDRIRDGRSFATRRVVGTQGGHAIFNLQASFHAPEAGYEHQLPMPAGLPDPDTLRLAEEWKLDEDDERRGDFLHAVQPVVARVVPSDDPYRRFVWFRANGRLPDDPVLHQVVFTYASDLTLLGA